MRRINKIIIHCSYSRWGNLAEITKWHTDPPPKGNGWSRVGYHKVILNAYPTFNNLKQNLPDPKSDGEVQRGLFDEVPGIHVRGHNHDSLGICYMGGMTFDDITEAQYITLLFECEKWVNNYDLTYMDVYGHNEFDSSKSCPNIDIEQFRSDLRDLIFQIKYFTL